ncbi:MAG TPA: putative nucleotidyltransferase substrate binding domain-containing protein [Syntrophorhabdaceae bacterium]|nr:putative nucleotidyltransferase substrate binding domain-containing protein [Syntrophorhabdaceae bacterium]HOD75499.1 putative nucleotidyltransferase substrate binding domain-containing protein [Syntrophorhabdaceae bacterium]
MPLNFSLIESFIADHQKDMRNKAMLRHDRYRVLSELGTALQTVLKDYEIFETELNALVIEIIDNTSSYETLRECHERAVAGVENFFLEEDTIVDVHDLLRIIRDRIAIRVLELVEKEMIGEGLGKPPVDYVWAGLGSEGRDEQTLVTDQDNLLVYAETDDGFASDELRKRCAAMMTEGPVPPNALDAKTLLDGYFRIFAGKASDRLHQVGFEKCKGGVMPVNDRWRGSIKDWKKRIDERMTFGTGIFEPLDVIILTDARRVNGSQAILGELLDYFFALLTNNKHFMKEFIQSAVLMPSALTFFGGFKVEKEGENKDKFNIKLLGWSPLILSVRMLSLSNGIYERNTLKRIAILRQRNIIKKEMESSLTDAYFTFVRYRIINQINYRDDEGKISNFLRPDMLGPDEQERLRRAMKAVEAFQKFIQETLLFGEAV